MSRKRHKVDFERTLLANFSSKNSYWTIFGKVYLFGKDKSALRIACFERDGYCCTKCGKANGKDYLDMHHIKHLGRGGDDSLENVTTRCKFGECHRGEHPQVRLKAVSLPAERFPARRAILAMRTRKQAKKPNQGHEAHILMETHLSESKLAFQAEYKFHSERKWAFDWYLTGTDVAIECEGGVWTQGRHTRGSGFVKDMEKYNEAAILGYRVLRFTTQQILDGTAIATIKRALDT